MMPPHFRDQKKAGERQDCGVLLHGRRGPGCGLDRSSSDLVCPGCPESLAKVLGVICERE